MKISTKGRYAVRLMLDVAIHGMDKNVSCVMLQNVKIYQ